MRIAVFGYTFKTRKDLRRILGLKEYGRRIGNGKRESTRHILNEQYVMQVLGTNSYTQARKQIGELARQHNVQAIDIHSL